MNCTMSDEWMSTQDLEGSDGGLVEVQLLHFPGGTEELH
jgi:hypothetical protein